jgi:catechol 2,3-dioxygenase-like lactoylglutathione lyase family enzyme
MSVTGFFHAGVTVSDMDVALRFYRDVLGLKVLSDGWTGGDGARRVWGFEPGKVRIVFLAVPGSDAVLELFDFGEVERHPASARPCDFGAGHMCLYVEDAEALHERALAHGYRSRGGEVVTIDQGPHAGAKAVYLVDADGYHVELYEKPRAAAAG